MADETVQDTRSTRSSNLLANTSHSGSIPLRIGPTASEPAHRDPHISTMWPKPPSNARDSYPLLSKVLDNHAWSNGGIACGVASMRGFRAQMEDSASILRPMGDHAKDKFRFCGVFDGHAQSRKVASTLEELLPRRIGEMNQKHWTTRSGLEKACMAVDREILRSDFNDAGSTAIFCLIDNSDRESKTGVRLTLGSVGDSQAVIIHSDFSKQPTVPFAREVHRPHLMESETDRIKRAGGFVSNGRVDGELAVSRAFGDAKFKRDISRRLHEQKVIALPSVAENIDLKPGDTLLLACDGLFDVLTAAQIDTFIRGCWVSALVKQKQCSISSLDQNPVWNVSEALSEIAGRLIDEALLRGSRDNMTVMLIQVVESGSHHCAPSWTDKFARRYIPPILFLDTPSTFLSVVRDELRSYALDEDLVLSQCETVIDTRVCGCGFQVNLSRSQMSQIIGPAFSKQWENRDSWVRLGDFEIRDPRLMRSITPRKPTRSPSELSPTQAFFKDLWMRLICFTKPPSQPGDEKRAHPRLSSSVGVFGAVSSIHVSAIEGQGAFFTVSSIEGDAVLQSRQTSCDDDS